MLILTLMVFGQMSGGGLPELDKMVESRRSFATADIRWTIESDTETKMYRRSRYDGVNWILTYAANPDGVVHPKQLGRGSSCSEEHELVTSSAIFIAVESNPQIGCRTKITPLMRQYDARMLGIAPEFTALTDLKTFLTTLRLSPADVTVQEKDGSLEVVVAKLPGGGDITWRIDRAKNNNPVRTERHDANGVVTASAISELELYGHVWFPRRVVFARYIPKRNGMIVSTIEVQSAEFDLLSHPAVLTLSDIGAVPYNQVMIDTEKEPFFWDGNGLALVSYRDMVKMNKDGVRTQADSAAWRDKMGRIDPGFYPKWYSDPAYGISMPSDVDEWEKYVRRFCLIRKCDDRQKASAKGVLDDCRKTAVPLLARIKTEQAKEKDAAKREAMLTPIADIFTKNLVPRLEALLATPQSQPTSKPAA